MCGDVREACGSSLKLQPIGAKFVVWGYFQLSALIELLAVGL